MQTMTAEYDKILRSYAADSRIYMARNNISDSFVGKESSKVTPIKQSQQVRCRHLACDDKMDCISTNYMPANMTTKVRQGPGQHISHRPVRLGINM